MTDPKIIENMEDLVRTEARYTAQQIGNLFGISKGTTFNMCECKTIEKAVENVSNKQSTQVFKQRDW